MSGFLEVDDSSWDDDLVVTHDLGLRRSSTNAMTLSSRVLDVLESQAIVWSCDLLLEVHLICGLLAITRRHRLLLLSDLLELGGDSLKVLHQCVVLGIDSLLVTPTLVTY
jgi:hypothetical protein